MNNRRLAVTLTTSALLTMPSSASAQAEPAPPSTPAAQAADAQDVLDALCYVGVPFEVAMQADYVCPTCGERTTRVTQGYVPAGSREVAVPDIEECRRLFARLPVVAGYKLDESGYCAKCSPRVKSPSPTLLVTTTKGQVRRVRHVTTDDLRLLGDYFAASAATQAAMSKDSRRLRRLLGK